MKKSTTAKALKENLKGLTSTTRSKKKSNVSSTRKTQTTKGKTTSKSTTTQRAKAETSTTRSSKNSDPKYTRSRNDDLFPTYRIFPWRLEPRNGSNMNLAWFQCYEHAKQHIEQYRITKYKLLAHSSLPIDCTPDHRAHVFD